MAFIFSPFGFSVKCSDAGRSYPQRALECVTRRKVSVCICNQSLETWWLTCKHGHNGIGEFGKRVQRLARSSGPTLGVSGIPAQAGTIQVPGTIWRRTSARPGLTSSDRNSAQINLPLFSPKGGTFSPTPDLGPNVFAQSPKERGQYQQRGGYFLGPGPGDRAVR